MFGESNDLTPALFAHRPMQRQMNVFFHFLEDQRLVDRFFSG